MGNQIFLNLKKFANLVSLKEHISHVYKFDNCRGYREEKWQMGRNEQTGR